MCYFQGIYFVVSTLDFMACVLTVTALVLYQVCMNMQEVNELIYALFRDSFGFIIREG